MYCDILYYNMVLYDLTYYDTVPPTLAMHSVQNLKPSHRCPMAYTTAAWSPAKLR